MSSSKPPSNVQIIDPYKLFDSRPTFSHVAASTGPSRMIITAGQVGADSKGKVSSNIDDQIALAFVNLGKCLKAAGATITDIIKLTYYIVNYDPKNRIHTPHLIKFLNGHRPATTLVPVPALAIPEYLFEVEATASIPQSLSRDVDVVIVGAGLSGLQAAYDLQKAGTSCVVLEARDRVGGKTWSVDATGEGKIVDVGAAWINDTNQAKLSDANGSEDMVHIRELVEETCQRLDLDNLTTEAQELDKLTFEEFITANGKGPSALASATVWTRAMLGKLSTGLEPREISALFFLDYCNRGGGLLQMRSDKRNGGQYMRLSKGTQSLSIGLHNHLTPSTVLFYSPVHQITQTSPANILVSSARGDFTCRKAIISIPTPLYKTITFSPPLPSSKTGLSSKTVLGYTNKAIVLYDSPWWKDARLCGMVQSFLGPISVARDSSCPSTSQYSLTCFLVGDLGRALSLLSPQDRKTKVLQHIEKLFEPFVGKGNIPAPIAMVEHEWMEDMWSQGCPCPATGPGVLSENWGEAGRTVGGLHFVGTETAGRWKGYMEGALESGERGAEEVLRGLRKGRL